MKAGEGGRKGRAGAGIGMYISPASLLLSPGGHVGTHRYRITVAGALGGTGRQVFADFAIETSGARTVLSGDLDDAALYGMLNRVQVLGEAELAWVRRQPNFWQSTATKSRSLR